MQFRVIRIALFSVLAASVLAASVVPVSAIAQEAPVTPQANPTITGPYSGCGARLISGGDSLTVGGAATPGSTVKRAVIQQFDDADPSMGEPVGTAQNVPVTIAADGQLSGGLDALAAFASSARSIVMHLTVTKSGVDSPVGQSEPLVIDLGRPSILRARTTTPTTIEVDFSEPVTVANGDSPTDWFIEGDMNRRPSSVTGTGALRILRFQTESFPEDHRFPLQYAPTAVARQAYVDCVGKILLAANRSSMTLDAIAPVTPLIDQIDSSDATDDRVAGQQTQPAVKVSGLSSGHEAELWLESNGTAERQDTDTKIGAPVTESGGEATIQSSVLGPNSEYTFYARAIDIHGNVSDGADDALYRLDTLNPVPESANTDDQSVTVAFDDNLATGRNDPADWTITVAGVMTRPTQVTGSGQTRQLHAAHIPGGAFVSYVRPAAEGYADEAGNGLASFENVLVKALVPTTVDLEPETASLAAGEDHDLVVTVTDAEGTLVPGAIIRLRSMSGPSSDRNMDGDSATPVGVIGSCRTGSDGTCTFSYTANGVGRDVLQAWLGNSNAPPAAEPRDGADLRNGQDVAEVDWHLEGTTLRLDAIPESGTGPTNAPHVSTLSVFFVGGPTPNSPVSGINVDGRVLEGPNQGDHIGECVTKGDGSCTISYTSSLAGTDRLQFWIDSDDDNSSVGELTLNRNESRDADASSSPLALNDDAQDVTERSWAGSVVPVLQVEPESSTGQINLVRSLVLTTTAQGSGNAIAGLNLDARVLSGPNAGAYLGECTTDGSGRCTLANYVSSTAGTDVIQGWIDVTDDDVSTEARQFEARNESTSADEPDQDVVEASWTPDPAATASPTPTASGTATPGPTPSASSTPTGDEVHPRTIDLDVSSKRVGFKKPVVLSGDVTSEPACQEASVQIERRGVVGRFKLLRTVEVDDGTWSTRVRHTKNAEYRARIDGSEICAGATSGVTKVFVRARVIARGPSSVDAGDCFRIRGRVNPGKRGQTVYLQERDGGRWAKRGSDSLNKRSRYRFRVCSDAGSHRFRIHYGGDARNASSNSRRLSIRIGG